MKALPTDLFSSENALIQRMFHEPMAIMLDSMPGLLLSLGDSNPAVELRDTLDKNSIKGEFVLTSDRYGNPIPKMVLAKGLAFIQLKGTTIKGGGNLAKWYGMAELDTFNADLAKAKVDPEVRGIVLDVASGGGYLTGIEETANEVKNIADNFKPVMTYTDSMMGSAAYYVGSGASVVYATPSSMIGSIGSFVAFQDVSAFMEKFGIKMHVFRSGEHKGVGIDGVSKNQAKHIQERVETAGETFRSFVSSRRSLIKSEDMQGQAYFGTEAGTKGFLTAVVSNMDEAVRKFMKNLDGK